MRRRRGHNRSSVQSPPRARWRRLRRARTSSCRLGPSWRLPGRPHRRNVGVTPTPSAPRSRSPARPPRPARWSPRPARRRRHRRRASRTASWSGLARPDPARRGPPAQRAVGVRAACANLARRRLTPDQPATTTSATPPTRRVAVPPGTAARRRQAARRGWRVHINTSYTPLIVPGAESQGFTIRRDWGYPLWA